MIHFGFYASDDDKNDHQIKGKANTGLKFTSVRRIIDEDGIKLRKRPDNHEKTKVKNLADGSLAVKNFDTSGKGIEWMEFGRVVCKTVQCGITKAILMQPLSFGRYLCGP